MSHTRTLPLADESYLLPYMTKEAVAEIFRTNSSKKWLVRASSVEGMMTIDLVNTLYNGKSELVPLVSHRIAALPYQGWMIVNSSLDVELLNKNFCPITAETFHLHRNNFERYITTELLKPKGYNLLDRISPAMYSTFIKNNKNDEAVVDESIIPTQPIEYDEVAPLAKRAHTEQTQVMTRGKTILGIRSNSGNGSRPAFFRTPNPLTNLQTSKLQIESAATNQRSKRNRNATG